jgi:hypothetical protein
MKPIRNITIVGRITWVCATCSETFTRRYGANRHNHNLHGGEGIVVRLLDYMVGIANGQILSRDDKFPSGGKGRQSRFFSFNSKKLRDNYQQTAYPSVVHENISSKPQYKQTNSGTTETYTKSHSSYHFNNCSGPLKREDNHRNGNNPSSDTGLTPSIEEVQKRPKLQEIRLLLNKYNAPNHAKQFFDLITHMAIIVDEENIDKLLAFLREADRQLVNYGNLFEVLSNGMDRIDKLPNKLDLSLPQQVSDKEIQHKMSPEKQGKATLASIEQLLSPHYPQQFVRNVITVLTKEFEITGDLSSLNTAFENHQKNVQRLR